MPRCGVVQFYLPVFSLLFSMFSFTSASAQNPRRDLQALHVLRECVRASGMSQRLPHSVATGRIDYPWDGNSSEELTFKTADEDRVRYEVTRAGSRQAVVVNRGNGLRQRGSQRLKLEAPSVAFHRPEHIPGAACKLNIANLHMNAAYIGIESIGSRPAHHIKLFSKRQDSDGLDEFLSRFDLYIDSESFLVLKTERRVFSPDALENSSIWEAYYSDYRPVNGRMMPFRIGRFSDKQKHSDVVFTNINFDVTNPDSDFE